jgi:prepilin-type N-terminal cleavage/methylation domain-containing protein
MKNKSDYSSAGFTIVEILVAIAVGAILVTGLSNIVTTYVHISKRGQNLNLTNAFAEAKVEQLRNSGYNGLNVGTTSLTTQLPSKLPPSRTGSMVVTLPESGLKLVKITVQYKEQGKTASHSYSSYVGELGVGQ